MIKVNDVKKTFSKISKISKAGSGTSYDFTVRDAHRILANNFYTSNCNHPDIETFISIKRDLKKVTGANISIKFTDEFMNAVENDAEFTLRWPVECTPEDAYITKVVKAKDVWNKFIESAWQSAEPGALFWDTVTRTTPTDAYSEEGFGSVSTNPCVVGSTLVRTLEGYKTVKELSDSKQKFVVLSYNEKSAEVEWNHAIAFMTKRNAQTVKLITKLSCREVVLTPDHRVRTQRGWIEAKDLTTQDNVFVLTGDFKNVVFEPIKSVIHESIEDVYDLTVDVVHNFFANDILVHNCVTRDTQIAVADGRGYVEIGELADSGSDVPVYAYDNNSGKIIIKTMRNPRLTGKNMPVYKVTVEGDHIFKATGNHTMILRDGSRKPVKDLATGDQLWVAQKLSAKFNEVLPAFRATKSQDYVWVKDCNSKSWKSEHRMIWEANNQKKVKRCEIIHHIDFDATNNKIENLKLMNKEDHHLYHSSLIKGKNNPIFKIKADPVKFAEYSAKMSISTSGLNNPRAYDISNKDLMSHIENLVTELGRRPCQNDWLKYVDGKALPKNISSFRLNGKYFSQVVSEMCEKLGISNELSSLDPRIAKRALKAQASGYFWRITDNHLEVERACEWCNKSFWNEYNRREISFCGHSCSNFYSIRKAGKNANRTATLQKMHFDVGNQRKNSQLDVYTKLRFDLGRDPKQNEWIESCKLNNLPFRIGSKNGFSSWTQLKNEASLHNHRVISVEFDGYEDVFNGTVDDVHTLIFKIDQENIENIKNPVNILIASEQCGEIVLCPYDSCRLLAVNYSSFVDDAFMPTAKFNYDKFHETVMIAQRLMDDLVDLELEAIEKIMQKIDSDQEDQYIKQIEVDLWQKIKIKCLQGRRTGTGTTGLADALAMIGIRYGSNESLDVVDNLYMAFSIAVHTSSCTLAKERGSFPIFDYEKEKNHEYIFRSIQNCGDDVVEMWKTTGRRNIACSTIAPTGSVSCLTRTTSGIEPAYLLSYKRRRKLLTEDTRTPDFIDDLGDRWQEYVVYHHGLKQWMDVTGKTNIEESPYWGATSGDVDWLNSVALQATAQRHIDHSISKTCNFPNDTSKELISKAYINAWKSGCKGFTVYRDGSRTGVLVSTDEKQTQKKQSSTRNADKRPKEVTCDIHRVTIKGESWLVLVGVINGKPYEIFSGLAGNIEVPKKIKQGLLVKNGKKDGITTYNLVVPLANDDQIVFKDVVNLFDNPTHGAFTRTLSLTLRHEIPINFIVEQLQKDKDMFAFSKCLARVLKTYIPDGVKSSSTKKCDECGSGTIIYKEGCASCSQCSWSKCA